MSAALVSFIVTISRIGKSAWQAVAVGAMEPRFADLYTITEGNRCIREMNLNPLVYNPCDPLGRVMNYPRVWLHIAELTGNSPKLLACLILAIGFCGFLIYSYRINEPNFRIFYFGISILSPVALLGIERGNNDIAVLGICAVGIKLVTQSKDLHKIIGIMLIFLASILKLFPVVCLLIVLVLMMLETGRKKVKCVAIASVLLFLLVIFHTWTDVEAILKGTPSPSSYAYGLGQSLSLVRSSRRGIIPIVYISFLASLLLVHHAFAKNKIRTTLNKMKPFRVVIPRRQIEQQLLLSAILFASTLMVSSWAYRYVFAYLLIPPLLDLKIQIRNELRRGMIDKAMLLIVIVSVLLPIQGGSGISLEFTSALTTPICLFVVGICFGLALLPEMRITRTNREAS